MAELIDSGQLIDLILGLVALQALALLAWLHRSGRRAERLPLLANLAAGVFLLLALRAALTGQSWVWVAAALAAALPAHLLDLSHRLRQGRGPNTL